MDRVTLANLALGHVKQQSLKLQPGESWDEARPGNLAHQAVVNNFDIVRREALSAFGWGFATVRERLVESEYVSPEIKWLFSYVYPADCLKFLRLVDFAASAGGAGSGWQAFPDALDDGSGTTTLYTPIRSNPPRVPADALVTPSGFGLNELAVDSLGRWLKYEQAVYRDTDGSLKRVILANMPSAVGVYVIDVEDIGLWSPRFQTAFTFLLAARIAPAVNAHAEGARAFALWMKVLDAAKALDANESNPDTQRQADHIRARRST